MAALNALERLVAQLAKLPGLGPRSARRVALHLLKKREQIMQPLQQALADTAEQISECAICGNLDAQNPCAVCTNPARDRTVICVVEDVADLWALERSAAHKGVYHILGGVLSALDGIGPDDLRIAALKQRLVQAQTDGTPIREVIIALNATVDGQSTSHYLAESLSDILNNFEGSSGNNSSGTSITRLAFGLPVGGELDYLDDGTLFTALKARRQM